jgi:glycogen debranching enzyme
MLARIYRPEKTAMQSGRALTHKWVLEFEPQSPRQIEPLMGWTASSDMLQQVRLEFDSRDEAIAYADTHGIAYQVFEPHASKVRARAYSDNFRFDRKEPWTH